MAQEKTPPSVDAKPTTVLRAGPPPRGHVVDPTLAILGLLVLVLAVALGGILPKVETIPNQFRVSFVPVEEQPASAQGVTVTVAPDSAVRIPIQLPDNLYEIRLRVNISDDIPSSLPDVFFLKLEDPQGNTGLVAALYLETRISQPTPGSSAAVTEYVAVPLVVDGLFGLSVKPQDTIFETRDLALTADDVAAEFAEDHRQATAGTWNLLLSMVTAGDCPEAYDAPPTSQLPNYLPPSSEPLPVPSTDQANRAAVCQQATAAAAAAANDPNMAGVDPSNPVTIESLTLVSFSVAAELLG